MEEWCDIVEVLPDSLPHHHPQARWSDGFTCLVADLTVQQLRLKLSEPKRGPKANKKEKEFDQWTYEAEHPATKHLVRVSTKKDRFLLMIVSEQGRTVCSIPFQAFIEDGDVEDMKNLTLAKETEFGAKAFAFMKALVCQYIAQKFEMYFC